MDKVSFVGNADVNAIDYLYKSYLENPDSVDSGWQKFFEGFEFAKTNYDTETTAGEIPENFKKEVQVLSLIDAYRSRGHLFTKTNPVRERRHYEPTLTLENFGLTDADLNTVFQAGNELGLGAAKLSDIIAYLENCYCNAIGVEFKYIPSPERLKWFQDRFEAKDKETFSREKKIDVLTDLTKAVGFEHFLNKKYVGQKRFSVEGGEALIPALETFIQKGAEAGVEYLVVGMAHRGRLNTLTNILRKRPQDIFSEFEGKEFDSPDAFDGDVKYHLGFSNTMKAKNGKEVKLVLAPNPSHLEAVGPVMQGLSRSKIDLELHDTNKLLPIIIHGDAALGGQGVTYEVVQMSKLKGYSVGGTIHMVVNNQVGFTTNYIDGRSSIYCTGLAGITSAPVMHVNGDDVEAVLKCVNIALEYRQKFHLDVFIDLLCYRKYGHNEGDEPKFTQPKLYDAISKHPNGKEIYLNQLLAEGSVTKEEADKIAKDYDEFLENEFAISKKASKAKVWKFLKEDWEGFKKSTPKDFEKSPETGVSKKELLALAEKIAKLPAGKNYFRKIQKIFDQRYDAITTDKLDWGSAEMLAYASLLVEGKPVRLTGQDSQRGTFSHRHAVVKTTDTEEEVVTLNLINDSQAHFSIYNSLLSEYAVLGFEYGYSLATPKALTIWEAQFGDFYNGAQIIVDQYISAGEDKWDAQSGLIMLLPHGYEGQGAEHSSGRLERYLQLCADYNMQVVNCTTPANFFHVVRRQLARDFRKPLVVMSPKLLLRYPSAISPLEDLTKGGFQETMDDPNVKDKKNIDTVVLCSGKIYYEISEKAAAMGVDNIAFVRLEQLYPLPKKQLDAIIDSYKNMKNLIWAQEEPENMGAWTYIYYQLRDRKIVGITRPASASPAEGSHQASDKHDEQILEKLFNYAKVTA